MASLDSLLSIIANKLGIGVSAPTETLDVGGNARVRGLVQAGSVVSFPAASKGLELYESGNEGLIQAYDRDLSAWLNLRLRGLSVYLEPQGGAVIPPVAAGTPAVSALYAQSLVKGWVKAAADGSDTTAYNVSSLSDRGTGQVDVVWDRDFASGEYVVVAIPQSDSALFCTVHNSVAPTAGATTLDCWSTAGALTDPTYYHILAIGGQ